MAVSLPNGSTISIGSAYSAPITVSAISNDDPAEATAAAHGLTDGDIVVVTSGWSKLNGRTVRVDDSDTGTFAFEGIDSTDTQRFPAGGGAGSVREVTTWTQISQITESTFEGGEGQFLTFAFLEDDDERQIPTAKSAQSLTLSIGDDMTLPWFDVLVEADADRVPRAIKVALPSGAFLYYNAYVTFNASPTLTRNELMVNSCTLSFLAPATRYLAA